MRDFLWRWFGVLLHTVMVGRMMAPFPAEDAYWQTANDWRRSID